MTSPLPTRWVQAPSRWLVGSVRFYRFALSPWLGSSCRFEPSCSAYAIEALQRHGAVAGTALSAGRVLRCHPWCEGGRDDVPPTGPGLLTRLLRPAASRASSLPPSSPAEKISP